MKSKDFLARETGYYEKLGAKAYFIPYALPPKNPILEITGDLAIAYAQALQKIAQVNEVAHRVPNINRFIKAYIIKEALITSEIENIHTSLLDLYTQPMIDSPVDKQTQLVLNYTKALEAIIALIKQDNLPIVSRVILEAHRILMEIAGSQATPGHYRKQAVRVGNLVPPPPQHVPSLMADLEKFINADNNLPPLIKAGLVHVQFETIHPFLDGNGRIGRMLIILMLMQDNLLIAPLLYPSYAFKKYHREYYRQLDLVRTEGNFESWLVFFLEGMSESCTDAYERIKALEELDKNLQQAISNNSRFKNKEVALKCLNLFFQFPVISTKELAQRLDKSYNTAATLIELFIAADILLPMNDQKRNKLYRFDAYLELLEKEMNS